MTEKYLDKLNFLIEDENEAIDGYVRAIELFTSLEKSKSDIIIKQLEHIKEEEEEHIRELEELKKVLEDAYYTPDLDTLNENSEPVKLYRYKGPRGELLVVTREEFKDKLNTSAGDIDKFLNSVFYDLVPDIGPADTVAGEIVRALNRIAYRYYNYGDYFYDECGLETVAPSVAYLLDMIKECGTDSDFKECQDILNDILENALTGSDYYNKMKDFFNQCLHLLVNSDEDLFSETNKNNSVKYDDLCILGLSSEQPDKVKNQSENTHSDESLNDEEDAFTLEEKFNKDYLDKCEKVKEDYMKFNLNKKELKEGFTEEDLDDDAARRCCFKYNCGRRQLMDMLKEVI